MDNQTKEKYLKLALVVFGIVFLLVYPLGADLAFGLDLARRAGQLLFPDDLRRLCGARHLSDRRGAEPGGAIAA